MTMAKKSLEDKKHGQRSIRTSATHIRRHITIPTRVNGFNKQRIVEKTTRSRNTKEIRSTKKTTKTRYETKKNFSIVYVDVLSN